MIVFCFGRVSVCGWVLLGFLSQAISQETVSTPPLPPQAKPFTEFFRKLLSCTPAEQEKLLTAKSPAARLVLQQKLDEYKALPLDEREARLRMLDLRSYLSPLLSMPPSDRVELLARIPAADRPVVEARLRLWDGLPPELQKEVCTNETAITYVVVGGVPRPAQPVLIPGRRQQIETAVSRWKTLPEQRQVEIYAQLQRAVVMSAPRRPPTPPAVPEMDRQQMQIILQKLDQMPPNQRSLCLSGFQKFATLSEQERLQFLRNAARWQAMSLRERHTLSNLTQRLPPAPPGLLLIGPPTPPGMVALPLGSK